MSLSRHASIDRPNTHTNSVMIIHKFSSDLKPDRRQLCFSHISASLQCRHAFTNMQATANMRGIRRLIGLSRLDLGALVCALWLLPIAAIAARVARLPVAQRLVNRLIPRRASLPAANGAEYAAMVGLMVSAAARRGPFRVACLPQSMVAFAMLDARAISATLNVGVKKDMSGFAAHAWVRVGDAVIIGDQQFSEQFETITTLNSRSKVVV
jgi:hypothetical protein